MAVLTLLQIDRLIHAEMESNVHNPAAYGALQALSNRIRALPGGPTVSPAPPPAAQASLPPQPGFPGMTPPAAANEALETITSALASISQRLSALEIAAHNTAAADNPNAPPFSQPAPENTAGAAKPPIGLEEMPPGSNAE
jgi:hypothetical protein